MTKRESTRKRSLWVLHHSSHTAASCTPCLLLAVLLAAAQPFPAWGPADGEQEELTCVSVDKAIATTQSTSLVETVAMLSKVTKTGRVSVSSDAD